MAKIGLNNFRYSFLTEASDGTPSYSGARKPAKAISCNVSVNSADAKLFADDVLAESDTSFTGGTVTIGIDREDNQTMADMLGHTLTSGGLLKRNSNDSAPYIGFGRIVTLMVDGQYKYRVEVLYKTKFKEPSQENNTKGESMEFSTTTLEGTVNALANGDWSCSETFNTKGDAITFLETTLGGSSVLNTYEVSYNLNGGSGVVATETVTAGDSITLPDGTGITPPSGKTFLGWAKTSTAQSATVSSPFTPTDDTTLFAIYADA